MDKIAERKNRHRLKRLAKRRQQYAWFRAGVKDDGSIPDGERHPSRFTTKPV